MFAPVEMSELDIFVPESDIDAVAETLARLSIVHLQDPSALGKWGEGVGPEWLGRVTAYTTQERRVEELLGRLGMGPGSRPWKGRLNPADDLAAIEEELREIETEVYTLTQREAELKREILYEAYAEAAKDPVFMDEMREISAEFDSAVTDGLED